MKQIIYLSCFILGILYERTSTAAQKDPSSQTFKSHQVIENPLLYEEKCLAEINQVRQEHGLKPLKQWMKLSDCARDHSQNMATGKCSFGHDGFEKRADQMQEQAPLSSFAENVAYNYNYEDPIKIAVDGWMKSNGHRKNILGDFEETGMGVAISKEGKIYFTQLFAKRF